MLIKHLIKNYDRFSKKTEKASEGVLPPNKIAWTKIHSTKTNKIGTVSAHLQNKRFALEIKQF